MENSPPKQPWEFYREIEWVKAIQNWNYGQPNNLAAQITMHSIPKILKPVVGKIVSGEKQNTKRGISSQKITPSDRIDIALRLEDENIDHEQFRELVAQTMGISCALIKKCETELRELKQKWPNI